MSFRTRLTLFFVLIVVVPMIALVVVVARLVADSEQGKVRARVDAYAAVARDAYGHAANDAARAARALAIDPALAAAIARGDARAARARLAVLASRRGLARVVVVRRDRPFVTLGDPFAIASGSARIGVRAPGDRIAAVIGVSTTRAVQFGHAVPLPTGALIAIARGPRLLAAPRQLTVALTPLPTHGTTKLATTDYAVAGFRAVDASNGHDTIAILTKANDATAVSRGRTAALALLGAFLLLALAGALLVSRQLQSQLGRVLAAVKQIGGGDLGTTVPVHGNDEFAALGREFNSLTGELAQRLDELIEAKRQALIDELTGLFNHRRFQEVMATEAAAAERFGQPLGLLMLDIDDFKRINDTHGHQQGDLVLREVARVLREQSREIDEPARYGGEEMAVALPQTDLEGAYVIAERVREAVAALKIPRLDGAGKLRVTVSCGVASSIDAGKDALVADADAALYAAKHAGKNRSVCAPRRAVKPIPIGELPR
jgi:diguanylate cyclase (GGDEF)-like protein